MYVRKFAAAAPLAFPAFNPLPRARSSVIITRSPVVTSSTCLDRINLGVNALNFSPSRSRIHSVSTTKDKNNTVSALNRTPVPSTRPRANARHVLASRAPALILRSRRASIGGDFDRAIARASSSLARRAVVDAPRPFGSSRFVDRRAPRAARSLVELGRATSARSDRSFAAPRMSSARREALRGARAGVC
jgi:hypothetical protein